MNQINKFFILIFMCAVSAQSALPMEEAQPQNWLTRMRNSASGAFGKALSYCSLQQAKEAGIATAQSINENRTKAAIIAAATGAGVWGILTAANMYKWRERFSRVSWNSSLKYAIGKLDKPNEDDIRAVSIPQEIPASRINPHSVPRRYTHDSRERNFEPLINDTRMITAEDCTLSTPYYPPATVKHSGIEIIKRNSLEHKFQKLFRYPLNTNTSVKKIFINGMYPHVNEMTVYQKAKNLSKPTLYVTLKHAEDPKLALEIPHVQFTVVKNDLYVEIRENPFLDGAMPFDIELHLPQGVKKPEIIYSTQQEKPIKQLTY